MVPPVATSRTRGRPDGVELAAGVVFGAALSWLVWDARAHAANPGLANTVRSSAAPAIDGRMAVTIAEAGELRERATATD
jgi:hypothetical protein